jgi:hypothetical protein
MGINTYADAQAGRPEAPKTDGKQLQLTLKVADDFNVATVLDKLADVGELTALSVYPNYRYDY